MIGTDINNCERLFLHKDNENEIYVNNSQNLEQHQVDSLRFLYRQFKKKKLGAVLNFPPGSGKALVVALFLNAVTSLLKAGTLILCKDDEEIDNWKQMFLNWTEYKNDEIAVESSNPRVKKKIFLKKVEDLTSYLRCHWSVVIIKDENMCKTLQKVVLESDLKIWITSTDLKKDLSLLSFIYNWMFPKSNLNINEFLLSQDKQDKMLKSIIMNTFLDDFVLRENNLKVIKDTKNSKMLKMYIDTNQTTITRKNKDATRTKIKKSKRTIDDTIQIKEVNNLPTDVSCISNEDIRKDFQPEITGIKNKKSKQTINDDKSMTDINSVLKEGCSISNKEIRETVQPQISHNDLTDNMFDKSYDTSLTVNTVKADNSQPINPFQNNEKDTKESLDFKKAMEAIVIHENNVACVDENSTESLDFEDENTEIVDYKNDICNYKDTKPLDSNNISNINSKGIEINNFEKGLDANSMATEKSEKLCNDLDHKISDLEERTMRKFKGSLLDNLF